MDRAADLVFGEDLIEQLTLQNAACVEGGVLVYEATVSAGQVVDDHRRDPIGHKSANHVGTDVAGAAADPPRHQKGDTRGNRCGGRRGSPARSPATPLVRLSVAALGSAGQ